METKTDKFKRLFKEQNYKDALGVIKSFIKGFNQDEIRTLNIAWECITGKDAYYRQLGFNLENIKGEAYEIMIMYMDFKINQIWQNLLMFSEQSVKSLPVMVKI